MLILWPQTPVITKRMLETDSDTGSGRCRVGAEGAEAGHISGVLLAKFTSNPSAWSHEDE